MGEVKDEPGNPPGCCRHRSSAAAALTAAPPGSPARRRTGAGAGRPPGPRRPPARSCPGRRREGHPQPLPGEKLPTALSMAAAIGEGASGTRVGATSAKRGRAGPGSGGQVVAYLGRAARVPRCRDTSRAGCPRSPSARSASLACRTSRRHPSVAFR